MLTATAAEMVDTDQPNSSRSGSMSTPGTARNAAAPTSARKVTAATHHAGWIRREVPGRARSRTVTSAEHAGPAGRERGAGPTPTAAIPPRQSADRTYVHESPGLVCRKGRPGHPDVTIDSPRRGTDVAALWLS